MRLRHLNQRHLLDPFAYLRDVLDRIPATPVSQLPRLLPDQWKAAPAATPVATAE